MAFLGELRTLFAFSNVQALDYRAILDYLYLSKIVYVCTHTHVSVLDNFVFFNSEDNFKEFG